MNIISEGRLSYEHRIANILTTVRQQSSSGFILLSLSSQDLQADGIISIRDSRFITGAISNTDGLTGYPALKRLLSLAVGTYTLSQLDANQLADFDQDINIDLDRIIAVVPSLPENLSELFDQASLLDKVFSKTKQNDQPPVEPIITVFEPSGTPIMGSIKPPAAKITLLQRLVAPKGHQVGEGANAKSSSDGDWEEESGEWENQHSFIWFESLPSWQKILSVLMIVIIAAGLLWVASEVWGLLNPKLGQDKALTRILSPLPNVQHR
jgi:hypothetical protein